MNKAITLICLGIFFLTSCQQEENSKSRKEIEELEATYIDAFNDQDSDQLIELWSDQGVYINSETGEEFKGKEEIKSVYKEYFENNPDVELEAEIKSLTFPSENQAIEQGVATLSTPDLGATTTTYTVTYQKTDGKWKIERVSDSEEFVSTSHYTELQGLEWFVGEWVDQGEGFEVTSQTSWDRYKNFLIQKYKVVREGKLELEGQQIIGWDPAEKQIRSWMFDSDGGFAEGVWNQTDSGWSVEYGSTLPDGGYGSSVNEFSNITENSYDWSVTGREIDGEILPNVGPIEITRKR